jgi:NMD protein affecting ribosome stability and mRNA decay
MKCPRCGRDVYAELGAYLCTKCGVVDPESAPPKVKRCALCGEKRPTIWLAYQQKKGGFEICDPCVQQNQGAYMWVQYVVQLKEGAPK